VAEPQADIQGHLFIKSLFLQQRFCIAFLFRIKLNQIEILLYKELKVGAMIFCIRKLEGSA